MAAAQPNLKILSDSLLTAGQQVSLLPNLPTFNYERRLSDQFNTFQQTLQQGINEQFRLFKHELDARFERIDLQLEQINTRFSDLELSTKAEARNQTARIFNSHVTSLETKLHTLYNQRNEEVPYFPDNLAALANLNDGAITTLLRAYDLAIDGRMADKKRRFRYFVGAVIY